MAKLFLPVLSHFENQNPWSASAGRLRYRIVPTVAAASEESVLTAEVWEGPWAYEFAQVEETRSFPLSQEGLDLLPGWLEQWHLTMEARPRRTLSEDIARRDAALAIHAGEGDA